MKSVRKRFFVVMIILLLTLLTSGCSGDVGSGGPLSDSKAKEKVLSKLEERYDEKFEVKSMRYITHNRAYELEVYPVENPDVVFKARMHPMNNYSVSEGYTREQWFTKTSEYIKPFGNRISKKNLTFAMPGLDELFSKAIDNKWNFEYLKNNYSIRLGITIYAFKDITDENKEDVLKSVYDLVQFIKDEGFKTADIEINFYDEEYFKDKDVEVLYEYYKTRGSFSGVYNEYISKTILIVPKYLGQKKYVLFSEIKSYKDIEKGIYIKKNYYKYKKTEEEK